MKVRSSEITPAGQLTTLYMFCPQPGCTDGAGPVGGLVQANGNFYGTTEGGGPSAFGTVFEITPAGQLTTLYSFDLTDGAYPEGGLVQASDGNLHGMTNFGGNRLGGIVFSLPPGDHAERSHGHGASGRSLLLCTNGQRRSRSLYILDHQRRAAPGLDA